MGDMSDVFEAPPGWLTLPEVTERLGFLGDLAIDAIEAGRIEAVRSGKPGPRSEGTWRNPWNREPGSGRVYSHGREPKVWRTR